MRGIRGSRAEGRRVDAAAGGAGRVLARQGRARLTDVRIWAAAALLVAAAVVGAALLGRDGDTRLVMQASRSLSAGAVPSDLAAVPVPRSMADAYVAAGEEVTGLLRWPVAAGELVPRAAIAAPSAAPTRLVSVPVDPLHAPAKLAVGDVVDVWVTATDVGGSVATDTAPALVLGDVVVTAISTDGVGFAGGWGVELAIPQEHVAGVVEAGRTGVVDLVTVPPASQRVIS